MNNIALAEKLYNTHNLTDEELLSLIENTDPAADKALAEYGRMTAQKYYGKRVFLRGLIEFTNYCKNDCYYCGIRRSNTNAQRYRLTTEQILDCCKIGYDLGFRTFVLQGGEDPYYNDNAICDIVSSIRKSYPSCAITLSIGEKSYESYKKYFDCGANRYLLRHETADFSHYGKLHPKSMSAENRQRCLFDLKKIGYQVGCGIMVGSPYQTTKNIIDDLRFMQKLQPHMVGIGPFIPHRDTPFGNENQGSVTLTLRLLSIIRMILPKVLLPSTTALGTADNNGREMGILHGANVVMPNLSPTTVRNKYLLYDGKICTGDESAQCRVCLENRIKSIGYQVDMCRGDYIGL